MSSSCAETGQCAMRVEQPEEDWRLYRRTNRVSDVICIRQPLPACLVPPRADMPMCSLLTAVGEVGYMDVSSAQLNFKTPKVSQIGDAAPGRGFADHDSGGRSQGC